jgi:hypothetical protein
MEAACSDSALIGFAPSSTSRAQPPRGKRREKKRKRSRKFFWLRRKLIYLSKSSLDTRNINTLGEQKPKKFPGQKKRGKVFSLFPPHRPNIARLWFPFSAFITGNPILQRVAPTPFPDILS